MSKSRAALAVAGQKRHAQGIVVTISQALIAKTGSGSIWHGHSLGGTWWHALSPRRAWFCRLPRSRPSKTPGVPPKLRHYPKT